MRDAKLVAVHKFTHDDRVIWWVCLPNGDGLCFEEDDGLPAIRFAAEAMGVAPLPPPSIDAPATWYATLCEVRQERDALADRAEKAEARVVELEREAKLNASMLAKQCDLARTAETERDEARRVCDPERLPRLEALAEAARTVHGASAHDPLGRAIADLDACPPPTRAGRRDGVHAVLRQRVRDGGR